MARPVLALALVGSLALATSAAPGSLERPAAPAAAPARITVWGGAPPGAAPFGGAAYGAQPISGALISELREVEIADGELRVAGIAATADPASIQLRDRTEPGLAIAEQRFVPGAASPTELLARHVGAPITVTTPNGDVAGVLRAADEQVLVVEVGAPDGKRLAVMRRDGYVQDVRLPAGGEQPAFVWRVAAKRPGKHAIELSYRAGGMSWSADYLAVLDEAARTLDFSAWATVKNASGATFERAELTLVGDPPGAAHGKPSPARAAAPGAPRFTLAAPVRLGAGDSVQVELVPSRSGAKAQPIVTYEAMEDPSAGFQEYPAADCTENNGTGLDSGVAELALELPVPAQLALPEGRVRLFRRKGERLELVSEDQLRASVGAARIKLARDTEITGERKAISCSVDERARTIHEKVSVRVDNKGTKDAEVVIREYLWRWPAWRIEAEDRKGTRTGPQVQEYRIRVPAKGSHAVTYSVAYAW